MDAGLAYNGSGPAAQLYAKKLSMSPEGSKVSLLPVGGRQQIALINPAGTLPEPGGWVVA